MRFFNIYSTCFMVLYILPLCTKPVNRKDLYTLRKQVALRP